MKSLDIKKLGTYDESIRIINDFSAKILQTLDLYNKADIVERGRMLSHGALKYKLLFTE